MFPPSYTLKIGAIETKLRSIHCKTHWAPLEVSQSSVPSSSSSSVTLEIVRRCFMVWSFRTVTLSMVTSTACHKPLRAVAHEVSHKGPRVQSGIIKMSSRRLRWYGRVSECKSAMGAFGRFVDRWGWSQVKVTITPLVYGGGSRAAVSTCVCCWTSLSLQLALCWHPPLFE